MTPATGRARDTLVLACSACGAARAPALMYRLPLDGKQSRQYQCESCFYDEQRTPAAVPHHGGDLADPARESSSALAFGLTHLTGRERALFDALYRRRHVWSTTDDLRRLVFGEFYSKNVISTNLLRLRARLTGWRVVKAGTRPCLYRLERVEDAPIEDAPA